MTELLRKAVAGVERLPPEQQDFLAQVLLDEMKADQRWNESFERPIEGTALEELVGEAEADIREGRTSSIDEWLDECSSKDGNGVEKGGEGEAA